MYQIIASSLFLNKKCNLPGIGTLLMMNHSAETDFINTQIQSPFETIEFIVAKKEDAFFDEFAVISEIIQKGLKEKGIFLLNGIGTFNLSATGKLNFIPAILDPIFLPYVDAIRVIRQDATHEILVGDQQSTNTEMTEYYSVKPQLTDIWLIWAIVLVAIWLLIILLYGNNHSGMNLFGNISN
jgi:hypothetical protein